MYIRSAACISPFVPLGADREQLVLALKNSDPGTDDRQRSLGQQNLSGDPRLRAIEPDYAGYVDPKMIRRMSRIVKMGVSAAMNCLKAADNPVPGAIITGTAYGCLEDTGIFLRKMILNQEDLLSPTAFIQSTHNTVGAQVALLLKCHSYNNTIVHRAFSFEHALTESGMLLQEDMGPVLVGAIDEITSDSFTLLRRFGLYDRPAGHNVHPLTDGYAAGEAAAFFVLQREPSANDLGRIDLIATRLEPGATEKQVLAWIDEEVVKSGISGRRIGTVLDGSGLLANRSISPFPASAGYIAYKRFCGEFPTSSGFALWLGANLCSQQAASPESNAVAIFNRSPDGHDSLLILSPC